MRNHNALNGLLWTTDLSDLVDLYEAHEYAQEQIAQHVARFGYQEPLTV